MTRRRFVRLAMVAGVGSFGAAVVQLGCASILGFDDTTLRDDPGGGDGGFDARLQDGPGTIDDAASDAPVPPTGCIAPQDAGNDAGDPGAFFVQRTTGYTQPDGSYLRCRLAALEPGAIRVYVLTSSGFRGPLQNGVSVEGGVRFDAPPEGDRYVLDAAERRLYVVRGQRLDMGSDVLGRPDGVPASGETLTIAETAPANGGGVTWRMGGSLPAAIEPPAGSTRSWKLDVPSGASLFDGTKGDVGWLLGTKRDDSIDGEKVVEACALPDSLQMKPRETTSASVSCTTVPLRKTNVGITHQSLYKCLPNSVEERNSLTFDMWPHAPQLSHIVSMNGRENSALPENGRLYRAPLTRDASSYDVEFLVPAPKTWSLIAEARTSVAHVVRLTDGTTSPRAWEDSVTSTQPIPNTYTVNFLAPAAAAAVAINGKDVLANPVTGATRTPTIAITPSDNSSCSQPKGYRLAFVDARTGARQYDVITTAPTVTLLDGMLETGKEYVILTTTLFAEVYSQEEPWRGRLRTGLAVVTSHGFKP